MSDTTKPNLELLGYKDFWFYYQKGDDEGLPDELITRYFELKPDENEGYVCDPFRISLPCMDCEFVMDIFVDFYAINAGFRAPSDSTEYQIGWWDFGRWHPFGLRWDELMCIWSYWKENPGMIPVTPDQALLLMAKFVGIGQSEIKETPQRKQTIKSAYQRLGLEFEFQEINELASCTFLLPSEEDYEWTHDNELGYLFGGEYPCYSLRNRDHLDGEEGIFPFLAFREMIGKLPPA